MDRSRGSVAVINHRRPCIDRAALNTCECFGDNMSTRNWRGGGRGGRNNGDFARRAWKIQTRKDRSTFHRETLSFNGQALPLCEWRTEFDLGKKLGGQFGKNNRLNWFEFRVVAASLVTSFEETWLGAGIKEVIFIEIGGSGRKGEGY